MSATGYTPISLYYSTTASAVPVNTNLANGELAINITDGKLYYKDNGGTVRLLASNGTSAPVTTFSAGTTGFTPSSATSGAITLAGTLATTNGGTALTSFTSGGALYATSTSALTTGTLPIASGGTAQTAFTANYIHYGSFSTSSSLQFDGTNLSVGAAPVASKGVLQIGTIGYTDTGVIAGFASSVAGYNQIVLQNTNAGSTASTNFNVSNNNGTTSTNFGEFGINSSGFTGTGSFNQAGYTYLASASTDLAIGTYGSNAIHFVVNSGATDAMTIDTIGNLGIGTASPAYKLDVSGAINSNSSLNVNNTTTQSNILFASTGQTGTTPRSNVIGRFQSTATGRDVCFQFSDNVSYATEIGMVGGAQYFATGGTERMRITSAGNVGVGTTGATSMLQTAGSSSVSAFKTPNIAEVDTISATAATGTINYDVTTQSVLFYTSNASANWTVNFRGSSGTSLNTLMQTGESISATFLVTQGSTAYYNSAVTIDGTSVTPKWQGGTAPTSGNASSVDCYTYVIQKVGSASYVVLASQTKFA
jgi:hypothetical protein